MVVTNGGAAEFMSNIVPKKRFVAASVAAALSKFGFFFFSDLRNFLANLIPMTALFVFFLHASNYCLKTSAVSVF